jgi:predicted AAA+ superfamily ATPase
MLKKRYLTDFVVEDLQQKMVFVGGARQVGKTTFARSLVAPAFEHVSYLSWDRREDRRQIMGGEFPGMPGLVIFDEIHKYRKWKAHIKGLYDTLADRYRFLVTGSSRLDVYRRGGDSLQGRYHYYRLHPFSLAELIGRTGSPGIMEEIPVSDEDHAGTIDALNRFGGFPEPHLRGSDRFLRRWHNEKTERLFREDINEIEQIRDLGSMKLLSDLLPDRVGSLLSINAMREDLEVSHRAVSRWLDVLEACYYHIRIQPYARRAVRSIRKEPKLYLWDWSEVRDAGRRFENMIASHLLKLVHFLYDHDGYKAALHFLRNVDRKEVDFLVTVDNKPWFAVEAKASDKEASRSLLYYREKLSIPFAYQVITLPGVDLFTRGVRIVSAGRFLAGLI